MSKEFSARKVAQLLTQVVRDIVWPGLLELAEEKGLSMAPLKVKVGSGRKTYHCLEKVPKPEHHITFGERMVFEKRDPVRAKGWLTTREIAERGYYGGSSTYPNILAHTALHECAHAIQTNAGDRRRGEVHNEEFYSWLSLLHKRVGEQTLIVLIKLAEQNGIKLEYDQSKMEKEKTLLSASDLVLGKEYEFDAKGEQIRAALTKINRRTASFEIGTKKYRVPLIMIRKVAGCEYGEVSEVAIKTKTPATVGKDCVNGFEGKHFFLSNEFDAPIEYQGQIFKTAEHLFLWLTIPSADGWWRHRVLNAQTASSARRIWISSACPKMKTENWEEFQVKAMKRAVWEKFKNPVLGSKLLKTGELDLVAENSTGDTFFGKCEGEGENQHGLLLMNLRSYLQREMIKVAS